MKTHGWVLLFRGKIFNEVIKVSLRKEEIIILKCLKLIEIRKTGKKATWNISYSHFSQLAKDFEIVDCFQSFLTDLSAP